MFCFGSTSHSRVQENMKREFNISWALMIRHYRLVVEEHWLPVPFNIVQFLVLLPFNVLPRKCLGEKCHKTKRAIKEGVGQVVFWLVLGSTAVVAGTVLWIASALTSPFVWHKHYASVEKQMSRVAKTGENNTREEGKNVGK